MWALLIICTIAVICIVALSVIKTKKYLFFLIPIMLGFLFGVNITMNLGAGASLVSVWPTIRGGLLACLVAAIAVCGGLWIYQFGMPAKKARTQQDLPERAELMPVAEPAEAAAEEQAEAEEPTEAVDEVQAEAEELAAVAEEVQAEPEEPTEVAGEVQAEAEEPAEAAEEAQAEAEEPAAVAEEAQAEAEEPAEAAAEEQAEAEEPAEVAEEAQAEAEEPAEAVEEVQAEEEEDAEPEEDIQPEPEPEPEPEPQDPRMLALAKARELAQKGVVTLAAGLYRQAMQHDEYDETCKTAGRELMVLLIDSKKYDAARAHARAVIEDIRLSDAERKWYEMISRRIGA